MTVVCWTWEERAATEAYLLGTKLKAVAHVGHDPGAELVVKGYNTLPWLARVCNRCGVLFVMDDDDEVEKEEDPNAV